MSTNELQQQIFLFIKEKLPPHLSLADELQELLHISADSVYRRIRGEKPVSLPELKLICEYFHLSLDEMLQLKNESVLFQAPGLNGHQQNFKEYLEQMLAQFNYFNSFSNRKMFYLCKDLPFWYFYLFPGVAAFKSFLWKRTIHNEPELQTKKFSFEEFAYPEYFAIGQQVIELYNLIPSVELYNYESINSTINQITYYREAGLFANRKEENLVIDSFHELLDHLEQQAMRGAKFIPGGSDITNKGSLDFYVNELILGNNTILLQLNEQRLSLITYSVLSYLMTPDKRFAEKAFSSFNSLLSKSTLISGSGEKDRHRYFNGLHTRVEALRR
jgi:hypothetical protein